jgi:hypothetical protein
MPDQDHFIALLREQLELKSKLKDLRRRIRAALEAERQAGNKDRILISYEGEVHRPAQARASRPAAPSQAADADEPAAGPVWFEADGRPVPSARVVNYWAFAGGQGWGLEVLVDPQEASPDRLLTLSRWIQARTWGYEDVSVDFYTDLKAIRIRNVPASDQTPEDLEYAKAHWAGAFAKNVRTHYAEFVYPSGVGEGRLSVPLRKRTAGDL